MGALDDALAQFQTTQAQAQALGMPDVTGGRLPLMPAGNAPVQGEVADLTKGQMPPYVPPQIVGQPPLVPITQTAAPQAPAAAPQQQLAPATVSQTETQTTIAPKLTQEQKTNEQKAFDAILLSTQTQADLDAQKAAEVEQANIIRNKQLERQRIADAAEADVIRRDSDEATKKWLGAQDEYKQSLAKRGAKGFSENLGIGGGMLAAIAQGLGAFSAALNGGPNQAMAVLNRAADDYVRKQEREIDDKKGVVDVAQNAVAFFRQKGMDAKSSSAAARMLILDRATERVDLLASQYKNPEILQRAQMMKDQLQQQRVAMLNQQALNEQNRIVSKRVSGPVAGPTVENQLKTRALEIDVPAFDPASGREVIKTFHARTADEAKAIRDAQKVAAGVKSDLLAMEALVAGHASLNPQTKQKVSILNDSIRKKYIKLDELGVPTGKDLELSSVVGDPTAWTQTSNQTRALSNRVRTDLANRLTQSYEVQGFRE